MSSKRAATTELNHDNWNEEKEPEEAGTFVEASEDVLKKRVIKSAKRRLAPKDETSKSAFEGFTGFKKETTTHAAASHPKDETSKSAFGGFMAFKKAPTTQASASPFSFLASMSSTSQSTSSSTTNKSSGTSKNPENGTGKSENVQQVKSSLPESDKDRTEKDNEKSAKKSSEYFAQLKGLNESVAQWIKTHVDSNPFCILTPIFKDYAKYLNEIELKHGNETGKPKHVENIPSGSDATKESDNKDSSSKNENDNASSSTNAKAQSGISDWKPEKSIFGNVSSSAKSIFGNTEPKSDTSKSIFSNIEPATTIQKPLFGNIETNTPSKSIFDKPNSEKNPLLTKLNSSSEGDKGDNQSKSDKISSGLTFPSSNTAVFSFGQSSTTTSSSAVFSFGNTKSFSFGANVMKPHNNEEKSENENKADDDEEPPKPDFKPVTEEGAVYEQRCKVFIKKDGTFSDRGIGTLFLKPTPNEKTQLIVRAENSLGNLLINTLLTESIPTQRMNKNTIMMVCLPDSQPPPTPVLLRVKTSEDADVLLETLNKYKK